ncbi:ATP/GTP-binding protein [Streptomyces sp. PTM05]|uniref:ATP/GTP-binding protein n=1 Tax=Streptantibioticus parmotrematis TaxID=2873249 RepID=A0ABS7R1J2_9ACTN|nr:ATP/GTP-binding protein [Streptantibioticus parmotrematis]
MRGGGGQGGGTQGGGGGQGASGAGSTTCTLHPPSGPSQTVPCSRPGLGTFNPSDGCYWEVDTPQPPASDPAWNGHKPGDGALYNVTCTYDGGQTAGGTEWAKNPPAGAPGGVDPAQLAQQAIKKLLLSGPDIGIEPDPAGQGGTVGVPVWMWNRPSPSTTGPTSASAAAGGITVTATATVREVDWVMGDGHTVVCANAGTPYQASFGMKKSPTCGYVYADTSADEPGAKYRIVATTTWAVHWVGGGEEGDATTTRASQVQIPIGEVQVVGG